MAPASRLGRPRRVSLRSASFMVHSPAFTPSQRRGSGSQRGETVPDPGQPGQRRVRPGDEVGQRAPGQVGRGHAVADVPAGPGQARGAVEADRGVPVARDAERAAPGVGEAGVGELREQLDQRLAQQRVHGRFAVEGGADGRAVVVRRPPSPEGDAVVGRALPVDDHVPVVGEGRPGSPSPAAVPEVRAQGLGGHHERVHRDDGALEPRQGRRPGLRGPHDDVGPHGAAAGDHRRAVARLRRPGCRAPRCARRAAPRAARPRRPGPGPGAPAGSPRSAA